MDGTFLELHWWSSPQEGPVLSYSKHYMLTFLGDCDIQYVLSKDQDLHTHLISACFSPMKEKGFHKAFIKLRLVFCIGSNPTNLFGKV